MICLITVLILAFVISFYVDIDSHQCSDTVGGRKDIQPGKSWVLVWYIGGNGFD